MGLMLSVLVFSIGVLEALSCAEHVRQSYLPLEVRRKRRRLVLDVGTGTLRHRDTRPSREFIPDATDYLRSITASLPEDESECEELVAIFESRNVHSTQVEDANFLTLGDGFDGRVSCDGSELSRVSTPSTVILNADLEQHLENHELTENHKTDDTVSNKLIVQHNTDKSYNIRSSTDKEPTETSEWDNKRDNTRTDLINNTSVSIETSNKQIDVNHKDSKLNQNQKPSNAYTEELEKENSSEKYEGDNARKGPRLEIDRLDLISDSATISEVSKEIERDARPSPKVPHPGDGGIDPLAADTIGRDTTLAQDQVPQQQTPIENRSNLDRDDTGSSFEEKEMIMSEILIRKEIDSGLETKFHNDFNREKLTLHKNEIGIHNEQSALDQDHETTETSILTNIVQKLSGWLGTDKSKPNSVEIQSTSNELLQNNCQQTIFNHSNSCNEKVQSLTHNNSHEIHSVEQKKLCAFSGDRHPKETSSTVMSFVASVAPEEGLEIHERFTENQLMKEEKAVSSRHALEDFSNNNEQIEKEQAEKNNNECLHSFYQKECVDSNELEKEIIKGREVSELKEPLDLESSLTDHSSSMTRTKEANLVSKEINILHEGESLKNELFDKTIDETLIQEFRKPTQNKELENLCKSNNSIENNEAKKNETKDVYEQKIFSKDQEHSTENEVIINSSGDAEMLGRDLPKNKHLPVEFREETVVKPHLQESVALMVENREKTILKPEEMIHIEEGKKPTKTDLQETVELKSQDLVVSGEETILKSDDVITIDEGKKPTITNKDVQEVFALKSNDFVVEPKEETVLKSDEMIPIEERKKPTITKPDLQKTVALESKDSIVDTGEVTVLKSDEMIPIEEGKKPTITDLQETVALQSNDLIDESKGETVLKSVEVIAIEEGKKPTTTKTDLEQTIALQSNDLVDESKGETVLKSVEVIAIEEGKKPTTTKTDLEQTIALQSNDLVDESKGETVLKPDEVIAIEEGKIPTKIDLEETVSPKSIVVVVDPTEETVLKPNEITKTNRVIDENPETTDSQESVAQKSYNIVVESEGVSTLKPNEISTIKEVVEQNIKTTYSQEGVAPKTIDLEVAVKEETVSKTNELPKSNKLNDNNMDKTDLQGDKGISDVQNIHLSVNVNEKELATIKNIEAEQGNSHTNIVLNECINDVQNKLPAVANVTNQIICLNVEQNENLSPNENELRGSGSRRNSSKLALQDITSELQNTDTKALKELLEVKESLKPVPKDSEQEPAPPPAKEEVLDKQVTGIKTRQSDDLISTIENNEEQKGFVEVEENHKIMETQFPKPYSKEVGTLAQQTVRKMTSIDEDVTVLEATSASRPTFAPVEEDVTSPDKAFWLIFSGEYTKAMSKDWHSGHFCCWQCDESLTGQRYVLRDDHPYCIKCYEQVFANTCDECSKVIGIDSKDLSYKDKHWHEACFLCSKCRVSLVDKQFGSKADKIYCGNCYDAQFASRCDGCGQIFRAGTKKMEYKTRQWHEQCFCCCVCKTPIGTKSFIPREQEIYCAGCYEEKFATRCVKCNKIITSGGVTYKNEPWHRECFTCTNCSTSLAGQRFTSRDEKPYCADCFGELFAKRCTACCKPITGIGGTRFISFEDRHWHNDCFICASCRSSLVGRGFITDAEDILCTECAKQKLM